MKIQNDPPLHLTYCLNVHPGETWEENFRAIRDQARAVRDRVAPGRPFGLGLRLSRTAATQLAGRRALDDFRDFLEQENLYVFTINGFPYGRFHGGAVKARVYSPDWTSRQRREYTILLADILAELLPEGVSGSISTVPLSYKPWIRSDADLRRMIENVADMAAHLAGLARTAGRSITLALEPEPDCCLETTAEAIEFLTGPLAVLGSERLRSGHGLPPGQCHRVLREHVGVCLDTAHAAVEFEDPADSVKQLQSKGVRIGKVQLSSALRVRPTAEARKRLEPFRDQVYLHQVKARSPGGKIVSYPDLPAALLAAEQTGQTEEEWRIHFHVPLFFREDRGLLSTSSLLTGDFARLLRSGATPQAEIETYTFDVLPEFLRQRDIADSIAEEYRWVLKELLAV